MLLDAARQPVAVVDEFMRSMAANGSPVTTLHSYACSLLRWWRFLAAIDVTWDRAGRVEVRDFVLWLRFGDARPGGYAPATINHSLAVLRSFYEERAAVGQGPVMNPVPAAAGRDGQGTACAPQPDGAVPPVAAGAYAAEEPDRRRPRAQRRRVQRVVRGDGFGPRSGIAGVLRQHRRTSGRAVGLDARSDRCRRPDDRRASQGHRPAAVAAGVTGRIRLVAPLRGSCRSPGR